MSEPFELRRASRARERPYPASSWASYSARAAILCLRSRFLRPRRIARTTHPTLPPLRCMHNQRMVPVVVVRRLTHRRDRRPRVPNRITSPGACMRLAQAAARPARLDHLDVAGEAQRCCLEISLRVSAPRSSTGGAPPLVLFHVSTTCAQPPSSIVPGSSDCCSIRPWPWSALVGR